MILDRPGMDIRPKTLRGTLQRMNYSFRMLREAPRKSAYPQTRKKFIKDAQKRMVDTLAKLGFVNFYQDEMTMLLSAPTSRGWLRTRRPRDDKGHILQEVGEGVFATRGHSPRMLAPNLEQEPGLAVPANLRDAAGGAK